MGPGNQPPGDRPMKTTTSLDVAVAAQVDGRAQTDLCPRKRQAPAANQATTWRGRHLVRADRRARSGAPGRAGPPSQAPLTEPCGALTTRLWPRPGCVEGSGFFPETSYSSRLLLELDGLRCWHRLPSPALAKRRWPQGRPMGFQPAPATRANNRRGCGFRLWQEHLCAGRGRLVPGAAVRCGCNGKKPARPCVAGSFRGPGARIQMVFPDPLACLNPAMAVGESGG